MTLSRIIELVSQAEREGITLAEMISKSMSSEQIDVASMELAEELSSNFVNIESYMSDVEVPSLEDIAALDDGSLVQIV
jgi:chromosome segregation and condensation protein ScpB